MRAVIFDLWDTLALWPGEDFERVKLELSEHIDDFDRVWDTTYNARQVGSIESYFRGLGLGDEVLRQVYRDNARRLIAFD